MKVCDKCGLNYNTLECYNCNRLIEEATENKKEIKEYNVTYKFGDISDVIEAESEEEAQRIADARLEEDNTPVKDAYCYDVEVEKVE